MAMGMNQAAKVVKSLDDLTALARVLADPKALASLRTGFADGLSAMQAETANSKAVLADAQALHTLVAQQTGDLANREKALAGAKAASDAANASVAKDASDKLASASRLVNNYNTAKAGLDQQAAALKRGQTALAVAQAALDARAASLTDREQAVVAAEGTIADKNKDADSRIAQAKKLQANAKAIADQIKAVAAGA